MSMTTTPSSSFVGGASAFAQEPELVARQLNILLADAFALYLKTKSFHWHVSGPHFREYHLLLDEQATELLAMIDVIAERVRKLGSATLLSIGDVQRLQRVADNDKANLDSGSMLSQLLDDNRHFTHELIKVRALCDSEHDVATASVVETFIDEAERRVWFLRETAVMSA